jgi:hypothetical protein
LGVSNARLTQTRKTLAVNKPVDINFDKLSTFFAQATALSTSNPLKKRRHRCLLADVGFWGRLMPINFFGLLFSGATAWRHNRRHGLTYNEFRLT